METFAEQKEFVAKLNLIEVVGRKDAVGRPSLYATTDEFLKKFSLESLEDLPEYSSLTERIKIIETGDDAGTIGNDLYKTINVNEDGEFVSSSATQKTEKHSVVDEFEDSPVIGDELGLDDEELPDYLVGEDLDVIE